MVGGSVPVETGAAKRPRRIALGNRGIGVAVPITVLAHGHGGLPQRGTGLGGLIHVGHADIHCCRSRAAVAVVSLYCQRVGRRDLVIERSSDGDCAVARRDGVGQGVLSASVADTVPTLVEELPRELEWRRKADDDRDYWRRAYSATGELARRRLLKVVGHAFFWRTFLNSFRAVCWGDLAESALARSWAPAWPASQRPAGA